MTDAGEVAERIRDELSFPQDRVWRILGLAADIEGLLGDGGPIALMDSDALALRLAVNLIREYAFSARRDLFEVELACARALDEDDLEFAA